MSSLIELATPALPEEPRGLDAVPDWAELAALWNANDMAAAHDWLNQRWSRLVTTRLGGTQDPEAEFMQGLAFATIALHFTQTANQEGALMMIDDALLVLGKYRPEFLGVDVEPVIGTLEELRPMIVGLAPDAECPMQPFVYRRFKYRPAALWSRA
ncbi:MAG: hypothetical protein Fur0039_26810 [Rhodocyclaceae bacterium]